MGWIFEYHGGLWYRFQNHKWVKLGKEIPINPSTPRNAPICRPFYLLKKYGFPTSLRIKKLPRCVVGSGKRASIYMWKGHKACRFLGGKLKFHRTRICKKG